MWYMKELNQFIAHKLLPSIKRQLTAKRAEAAHQHANRGNRPAMAVAQPDLTSATGQHVRHGQPALLQAAAATLLDAEHGSASGLSRAAPAEAKATAEQADESMYHRASGLSKATSTENAATAEQADESVQLRALLQVVPSSIVTAQHAATDANSPVESDLVSKFAALLQQQKPAEQLADLHEDTTPPFKQQAVNVLGVKRSQAFGTPQHSSRSLLAEEEEEEEEAVNMLGEEEARLAVADEVGEVYLYAAEDLTRIAPLWWNYTKQMRVFHETYAKVCVLPIVIIIIIIVLIIIIIMLSRLMHIILARGPC